ncbi:hypothetical protein GCM10028796_31540 [Ramlibacter monticola]
MRGTQNNRQRAVAGEYPLVSVESDSDCAEVKNPGGRPSRHSPRVAAAFCAHLMLGCTLREVCAKEGMPGLTTVMRWLAEDRGGFRAQYARAREVQAELDADDQVAIADEPPRTVHIEWAEASAHTEGVTQKRAVAVALDNAEVANRRLRSEARRWRAAKMNPKKYGRLADPPASDDDQEGVVVVIKNYAGLAK